MKPSLLLLLWVGVFHELVESRGSLKVVPDSTQFGEYENISVICEDFGPDDWTVWRLTSSGDLSQCGSGWGTINRSVVCDLGTPTYTFSGLYWCQSKYGDVSAEVNITVTGRAVILESPVQLVPGQDLVLSCRSLYGRQGLNVSFFRDGVLLQSGPDPQTTVRLSADQQGAYSCEIGPHKSLPVHLFLPDQSPVPVLVLSPDSAEIFEYSSVNFSCEPLIEGWTVLRHRPYQYRSKDEPKTGSACGSDWGRLWSGSVCKLDSSKRKDSGYYWCGKYTRRSNSVHLQVRDRGVILQMPVRPVTVGQSVSLTCQHYTDSTRQARFYRDGNFLSEQPDGHMTLVEVAPSDEGQYTCEIGKETSEPSWLRVRPVAPPVEQLSSGPSLLLLRYLLVFSPYVASTVLFISIYRQTGGYSVAPRRRRRTDINMEPAYEDVIPDVTTEYQF